MSIQNYNDLNSMHLDVLRELGNIGSGNAATSLADMLAQPVDISVPVIRVLNFKDVATSLGGPEATVVGMLFFLKGDLNGMIMFLMEKDFIDMILGALLGETVNDFSEIDEMGLSALKEIGNIMAGSYVNAIANMTGLTIDITVPQESIDMVGAILSVPAIHFANISDKIIFIEGKFLGVTEEAHSNILLIPDVASLEKIMTNLGIEI